MKNGKCRMHGGASTGARTAEGRARIVAARTIHGGYGAEAMTFRARISGLLRRGRVLCAAAKAGLSLEAFVPLVHQAWNSGNTPYAQGEARSATDRALRSLMTTDPTVKQAAALTDLIRGSRRDRPLRRDKPVKGKHPIRPENPAPVSGIPAGTPSGRAALHEATPPGETERSSGNTPCALKPNRAMRRKMASQSRHAASGARLAR